MSVEKRSEHASKNYTMPSFQRQFGPDFRVCQLGMKGRRTHASTRKLM